MDFNLTLQPPQLELIVKPGTTLTQAYEIVNNSQNTLILSASIEPWQPIGPDGAVSFSAAASPDISFSLAAADLKLNQNFRLDPGKSRQLVLKIRSSPNNPLGDNYYTFFISQQNSFSNTPQVVGKIGSHILISTSTTQTPPRQLNITKFSVSPRLKDIFFTPLRFTGEIQNQSDFYHRPEGKITLAKNNLIIKEILLDPQNVLAHSSRTIQCLPDCTFNPPFWPGLYTATISLDSASASTSISFFIFPYYFSLILGLFSLGFLLLRLTKH